MVSIRRIGLALILTTQSAAFARADFRVVTPSQQPVSDSPHIQPGDAPMKQMRRALNRATHPLAAGAGPRASLGKVLSEGQVEGFGAGVPLAFACQQIVPRKIKVVFGQGVDTKTPVNWSGGRSWAVVLRDAIQPAGLTLVPRGWTVEIRK